MEFHMDILASALWAMTRYLLPWLQGEQSTFGLRNLSGERFLTQVHCVLWLAMTSGIATDVGFPKQTRPGFSSVMHRDIRVCSFNQHYCNTSQILHKNWTTSFFMAGCFFVLFLFMVVRVGGGVVNRALIVFKFF